YTVTSREPYEEPVEILKFVWCLQVPPRCLKTHTEMRERWRTKEEVRFKNVPSCCEGYTMQEPVGKGSADAKCVPFCKKCLGGVCTAPNHCTCEPGFQGHDCASECPQGRWGLNCENKCNCLRDVRCNPVDGHCECPPGWMGSRCERKCPEGQWGRGCNSPCMCESLLARCHHENGECIEPLDPNSLPMDTFEASGTSGNSLPSKPLGGSMDYVDVIDFDKDTTLPRLPEPGMEDSVTGMAPISLPDEMMPVQVLDGSPGGKAVSRDDEMILSSTRSGVISTTTRRRPSHVQEAPTVVLGQPAAKSFHQEEAQRNNNFRVIVSPKNDYVKTTRAGGDSVASMSAIPIDVAAMIVVGGLISIGLTSVAVLMIFHVRSRLLKAALSMYSQDKIEREYAEKDNDPGKNLGVTIGTLPRGTLSRINPVYSGGSETGSSILTFDERPVEYANGTVTIGIRLSSHLRDLLESHYDRPASCNGPGSLRTAPMAQAESDVLEHVYDEIPLSAPLNFTKYNVP
ncbi:hypothetical protein QAD02_018230, partial [Eretmocerus hayati]